MASIAPTKTIANMDHAFHVQPTVDALKLGFIILGFSGDFLVEVLLMLSWSSVDAAVLADIRFRLPAMSNSSDALT